MYAEIYSIWILRALQVSHPEPWAHKTVQCVCACAYTHKYTHIHSHPRQNREDTDNTPIFPSVKNNPPRQATSAFID